MPYFQHTSKKTGKVRGVYVGRNPDSQIKQPGYKKPSRLGMDVVTYRGIDTNVMHSNANKKGVTATTKRFNRVGKKRL